jgi:hypothetical protein
MKRSQKSVTLSTEADNPAKEASPQERLVLYLQYAVPEVVKISPAGAQLLQLAINEIDGGAKAKESSRH